MLGRFCTGSPHRQWSALSTEDINGMKSGFTDYACPECGAQQYHLVFRVEALSHRVTLSIACDACRVRTDLLKDTHGPEDQYAPGTVTDKNNVPPHS